MSKKGSRRLAALLMAILCTVMTGCDALTPEQLNAVSQLLKDSDININLNVTDGSEDTETTDTEEIPEQIEYSCATKEEGIEYLMSNKEYYDGFTENELEFKMDKKNASMDEYLEYAKEQVLDFTDEEKAKRVWAGMEKRLSCEAMKLISVSWLSELSELNTPLFLYICKVFRQPQGSPSIERDFADPNVLTVTNIARRVLHEQLRMKQFIRFQKAKDGTYLGVVSPDHNVLPIIIDHFCDRFNDQPWLIYDAGRHYGYYYSGTASPIRITFKDEATVPFSLKDGKLDADVLSNDDQLMHNLWRTYFKAICIK